MSRRSVLALVATLASVVGLSSGIAFAAKAPSTTASTIEFSQCTNGGPGTIQTGCNSWINGILNSNNSHYAEDQVTPQRLLLAVPGGTADHTVTIRYLARKGNVNAHAYDSLARYDVTQTGITNPCQGFTPQQATVCSNPASPPFDMQSDPTPVPPATHLTPVTAQHELPQASRQWVMYGGVITNSTVPVHDNAAALGSDDYAKVTVTFHTNATSGTQNVLLLFGGHLAPGTGPRGWGVGLGSANINGGPYHIILDAVDGTGGGRDNQIMAGAILAGSPSYTITKTALDANGNPITGPVAPGSTVTYKIVVTNNGTADGTTTFTDNYDDRLNPTLPVSDPTGGTCVRNATGAPTGSFTCTTSTLAAGGGSQSFTYTAVMPSTFDSTASQGTCGAGQFAVMNTATLITGGSSGTTVCVSASPTFMVTKTATPSVTNPGLPVTYRITVTNTGSAPGAYDFTDDYDNRLTPSAVTTDPTGGSCTDNVGTLSCHTNVAIDPGHSMVFTYSANMPSTFSGSSDPCAAGQYPVKNVIVNTTAQSTVCVNASPTITYTKTAYHANGTVATTASPGEVITYKIVVSNGGTASGSTPFTDDFDDRLSPSAVTTSDGQGSCTQTTTGTPPNKIFACQSGNLDPNTSRTFTYTAAMPATFDGTPGTDGCSASNPEQFAVKNVVLQGTTEEAHAVVCVNASPTFGVVKKAYDANGVEITSAHPALPGDTVTYVITVSNTGTASGSTSFNDDYDNRLDPSAVTRNPNTGSCTDDGDVISCTTGTILANGQQTFTYTAVLPSTYTGFPGGFGCSASNPHQYPVRNVVTLQNGANDDATVCVNASPNLHLVKSAVVTTDDNGNQFITYTLTYSNTGPAEATLAAITETVPTGTSYSSCTGGCSTSGSPVGTVTWSVGPIAPLTGGGSVTMTVKVTTTTACSITNTATIQFMSDTAIASNTLITNVNPVPNPAGAHASGNAIAAQVLSSGLIGVNTAPISPTSSSQSGLGGPDVHSNALASIQIPSGGALLSVDALKTTSSSQVTGAPAEARDTTTAETAHVCVLPVAGLCTVEADTVRAVASTSASGTTASYSSAGTTIQNLKVLGLGTPVDLNQTTKLDLAVLSPLVFAKGSYVAINERTGTAGLSGGFYKADLTVTMIHVKATLLLGLQSAEIIVARATSHSDFPALPNCSGTRKSVSGHAYVAGATVVSGPLSTLIDLKQGFVQISPLGGAESQHIVALALPANGSLVAAQAADSSSTGTLTATSATSTSQAEVAGDNVVPACVLKSGNSCLIEAKVIHSEAHSTATSSGSTSTDAGTLFLGLKVGSISIPGTPAPNTVLALPGIGYLVLNEQFCDNGGLATHSCTGATHSGITVRAIDLVINVANNPLGLVPGVQVIVAEAHADSTYS